MRVTNEQAKAKLVCDSAGVDCPESCPFFRLDKCNDLPSSVDLAADLLDSRAIIEKQTAVIKEFHKVGREVVAWNVAYIPLIELLERTKEYA